MLLIGFQLDNRLQKCAETRNFHPPNGRLGSYHGSRNGFMNQLPVTYLDETCWSRWDQGWTRMELAVAAADAAAAVAAASCP